MIFTRTLVALHAELKAQYDVSSTIRHKGEKGRKREHGLGMFLREHLPERYGVATGEIIPFEGKMAAPQCDLIVYDRLTYPIIGKSSAVQQVPYESVYSVIEVKSQITAADLRSTSEKFLAIRRLPRCSLKRRPSRSKTRNPVFVLFGYELRTTKAKCVDFVREDGTDDLMVFALDAGVAMRLDGLPSGSKHVFLRTADAAGDFHETLVWFLFLFLEALAKIDLGIPNYSELLYDGKYEESR
jgi:hypothetical protein